MLARKRVMLVWLATTTGLSRHPLCPAPPTPKVFLPNEGPVNKGVLMFLMTGVGIGLALTKLLEQARVQAAPPGPLPVLPPVKAHRLGDRLRGFLEVERN